MARSRWIQEAQTLLANARKGRLERQERVDQAVTLAGLMLREAEQTQTRPERARGKEIARMMEESSGKAFTTAMTDQCFRSHRAERVADQLRYLLDRFGTPRFMSAAKRFGMSAFRKLSTWAPKLLVPITSRMVREEMSHVILPGEDKELRKHLVQRQKQGVRVNFNHLGEAILGEEEAVKRLNLYLEALCKPEVEYVSVKISSICSQLNLLAWEDTLSVLKDRLRQLYRIAMQHTFRRADGTALPKFVNLDMEEYRDLQLTVDLFEQVLDEDEFLEHSAGIVLQAYLPDAHGYQKRLTEWAKKRMERGGAPVKIRIVKGANLAMEQVESALHGWPQTPYDDKVLVDANYKRMLRYGCERENAQAVHLGVASHNLFDIAYALILREEMGVSDEVEFEMLEGMADHIRRVVQVLAGDMLLYCPAATEQEFHTAIAYLMRRLDENTAPQNFLRHSFGLTPGSDEWRMEEDRFREACRLMDSASEQPRRQQDRHESDSGLHRPATFDNEPDTDFCLEDNRIWAREILMRWDGRNFDTLPIVVGGKQTVTEKTRAGIDPSRPQKPFYQFSQASSEQIELAVATAKEAESEWAAMPLEDRLEIISRVADGLREHRGDLIGAMVADAGKTVTEADVEVSEAIDFAEYYLRSMREHSQMENIRWKPKGTVLVIPPWNFPCAIPMGGVIAGLVTGNAVIFKPASHTVLVAYHLAQICWQAGVPPKVLQFVTCAADPQGSQLVSDPRINLVILTGGTSTAQHFLKLRPDLDLMAETGGKNAMIVTSMADRDLAIKDVIQSAFGHSGQKCSAASLLILEKEVYDDPHFLEQLRDAAASLPVGPAWDLRTMVNPLCTKPDETLQRGLTTLDPGESWLLEPQEDPENPHLWSPGIKLHVKEGAFTHCNELFGPVLSIMRAENLTHALRLANATPYGLTAGLQSLDEREHALWLEKMQAGNYYINRGITGAIVRRQPFGGCKASSFGRGSKAGGPNYLSEFMIAEEKELPKDEGSLPSQMQALAHAVASQHIPSEDKEIWEKSIRSYAHWWERHFKKRHDPSLLQGQDNLFGYRSVGKVVVRVSEGDKPLDLLRACAAALICGNTVELSAAAKHFDDLGRLPSIQAVEEADSEFCERIDNENIRYVRFLQEPSEEVYQAASQGIHRFHTGPVLAQGRLELLHYVREISISSNYHRYGNLGERENELRRELRQPKDLEIEYGNPSDGSESTATASSRAL